MEETSRRRRERGALEASADARAAAPRRSGWISVYAVAFGLMVAAAVALAASSLGSLRSIGLLWFSSALSVAAIGAAIASVLVTRPR
jgi:hypothetical protein